MSYIVSGPGRETKEVTSIDEVIRIAVEEPVYRPSSLELNWSEPGLPREWPLSNTIDINDLPEEVRKKLTVR